MTVVVIALTVVVMTNPLPPHQSHLASSAQALEKAKGNAKKYTEL